MIAKGVQHENTMKILMGCMFSLVALSSWAVERGINYDPAHSQTYTNAQMKNDLQTMKNEILKDVKTAKNIDPTITVIKTFYSSISTVDGQKSVNMADLICDQGMKLMVGVYEFDPSKDNCGSWCDVARKKQVKDAIDSVNRHNVNGKKCIVAVVVGNEDIYNWNFTEPNTVMQKNISADIAEIKSKIGDKAIVGTAQQDGALLKLAKNDPEGIIGKLDFIGANIYPYWSSQFPNTSAAKSEFSNRYEAIKNEPQFMGKRIIVTEEGWPSQYSANQNPNATMAEETAYYQWWKGRSDDFDSYYFGLFDKQPLSGDADRYFGLCTYNGQDKIINICDGH